MPRKAIKNGFIPLPIMNRLRYYILALLALFCSAIWAQLNGTSITDRQLNQFVDAVSIEQNGHRNSSVYQFSLPYLKQVIANADTSLISANTKQKLSWYQHYYFYNKQKRDARKLNVNFRPSVAAATHLGKHSASEYLLGVDMDAWLGDNWYGNVGYSHQFESNLLTDTAYLSMRNARKMHKRGRWFNGGEINFCLGYFTDKLSVSFNNNRVRWGEGYHHTNIYSGNAPKFAKVSLNLKPTNWFEFNFFHGKLDPLLGAFVNDTVNSSSSTDKHRKYIAANLFTFKPYSFWNLSVGNSIVYSQNSVKPVYLIPFMFYKSADHTYNGVRNDTGQNAQMFFTTSIKYATWGRFYYSLFVDEITLSSAFSKEENSNLTGFKIGTKIYQLLPHVSAIIEYTHNRPMAYTHYIYATNFNNAGYNMGQPLEENANEWYFNITWQKSARTQFYAEYYKQKKGPELVNADNDNRGHIFLETVEFENSIFNLGASYQFAKRATSFLNVRTSNPQGDISYLPELFGEKGTVVSLGISYGL